MFPKNFGFSSRPPNEHLKLARMGIFSHEDKEADKNRKGQFIDNKLSQIQATLDENRYWQPYVYLVSAIILSAFVHCLFA